ncbi:hypothetical protein PG984_011439 [Apiospora sp. TS-2023a]
MTSNPVPQPPAVSDEDKKRLRDEFQGLLQPDQKFFVDMPPSRNYSYECRYDLCIEPERTMAMNGDDYRITVAAGLESGKRLEFYRPRHYHLACFALLVDWNQVENLNRLMPLTAATRMYRGRSWSELVDTGAEHLVWRWRELMYEWNKEWKAFIANTEVPELEEYDNFGRDSMYVTYPQLNPEQLSPASQKTSGNSASSWNTATSPSNGHSRTSVS